MPASFDLPSDLLAQLEEGKVRRLFRRLIDEYSKPGDSITFATPNSYVFARYVKNGAASATGWFFQLAYVPFSMCQTDVIADLFREQRLVDMRNLPVFPFEPTAPHGFASDGQFMLYRGSLAPRYVYVSLRNKHSERVLSNNRRKRSMRTSRARPWYSDFEDVLRRTLDRMFRLVGRRQHRSDVPCLTSFALGWSISSTSQVSTVSWLATAI